MKLPFTLDYTKTVFFIFLTLCVVDGRGRRRMKRGNGKCNEYTFAEYNLTFFGDWSRENFPRMYPRYRPKAQWSKLIGRTHGRTYHMWSEGQYASPALQMFVEERNTMLFDKEAQGYNDTRDLFTAAPIRGGVGRSSLRIFADGQHSKLSFVVKVIPSPDWFVGVDSLDLCKNGHWRRKIYAHLRPMDAGTDRGFTYTSPNWPAHPQEKIFQITPNFPNHPASSFYDETQTRVPRMAHAIIEKVVEYRKKGSPRMPLDPGSNVIVYEQEHERQERFRLMMKPTDTDTDTPEKPNLADPYYLTKLNAELQRKLQSPAIKRQSAFLDNDSLKNTLRRDQFIKNTMLDSPAGIAIKPTMLSRNSVPEKYFSKPKTHELTYTNSAQTSDQDPTPMIAEGNSESPKQPDMSDHSETNNHMDTNRQDVRTITPKLVLQKHLVMAVGKGTVNDNHLLGISQTVDHIQPDLQTMPDPTKTSNPTDSVKNPTHIDNSPTETTNNLTYTNDNPSDINNSPIEKDSNTTDNNDIRTDSKSNLSNTDNPTDTENKPPLDSKVTTSDSLKTVPTTGTKDRPIYSEAYRTDYMRDFSEKANTHSVFAILSDTPKKGSDGDSETTYKETTNGEPEYKDRVNTRTEHSRTADIKTTGKRTLDSETTNYLQVAQPTEHVKTKTHIYVKENPHRQDVNVVPLKKADKEAAQNTSDHNGDDDTKAESTVNNEPYRRTKLQNTRYGGSEGDLDCIVGDWSEWSPCSKTCGFGVKQRHRTVTQYEQNGGLPCPRLDQEALCGSMRNCKWNYFSNIFSTSTKRRRRRRRWHTRHG